MPAKTNALTTLRYTPMKHLPGQKIPGYTTFVHEIGTIELVNLGTGDVGVFAVVRPTPNTVKLELMFKAMFMDETKSGLNAMMNNEHQRAAIINYLNTIYPQRIITKD